MLKLADVALRVNYEAVQMKLKITLLKKMLNVINVDIVVDDNVAIIRNVIIINEKSKCDR